MVTVVPFANCERKRDVIINTDPSDALPTELWNQAADLTKFSMFEYRILETAKMLLTENKDVQQEHRKI